MINSLSIITPIYNTNSFIESYFDSIRNVSRLLKEIGFNFEFILIDDSSLPSELKIIEEYFDSLTIANKTLIRNLDNLGTYHSYWRGINESKSDYILLVDSDDELSIYLIEFLKRYIGDDDLIIFGDNYSNLLIEPEVFSKKSKSELLSLLLESDKFINLTKIIKRKLIMNIPIFNKDYRFAPDFHISSSSILLSNSTYLDGNVIIKANRRPDSVSRQYSSSYHNDISELFLTLLDQFKDENLEGLLVKKLKIKFYDYLLFDLISPRLKCFEFYKNFVLYRVGVKNTYMKLNDSNDKSIVPRKSMRIIHLIIFMPKSISIISILILKKVFDLRQTFLRSEL